MSSRIAIEEVFGKQLADRIWTASTMSVYPAVLQDFSVGSVLPAVFYMFRRAHRRGKGRFLEEFSSGPNGRPNIFLVAGRLSQQREFFEGFESELAKDILGDLLLCDALENKKHLEGQNQEILRAFPVHFLASWIDLPKNVASLRAVPEMLIALLGNQSTGQTVGSIGVGDFTIGCLPDQNLFLRVFGRGVEFGPSVAHLSADFASETVNYSVEELLMIRLGQTCGQAPEKLRGTVRGSSDIPNAMPLASVAAGYFRDDLATFLRNFGEVIPRRALTPMLEALISLGISHTFLASLQSAVVWERTGKVPLPEEQRAFPLFVDASSGADVRLRALSEQSLEEMVRFLDQATVALAIIRVLDSVGRHSPLLKQSVPMGPSTKDWLDVLGDVRHGERPGADFLLYDLRSKASMLAAKLEQDGAETAALEILRSDIVTSDPSRALAESICAVMPDRQLQKDYYDFFDSATMASTPNGLIRKRRISRLQATGRRKMESARSLVLSNTLLEALVHRHLAGHEGHFSFDEFVRVLREHYGLFVDEAPRGIATGREDLLRNRAILERRLRDLGLLVGVNDAESMKHLRSHYRATPQR